MYHSFYGGRTGAKGSIGQRGPTGVGKNFEVVYTVPDTITFDPETTQITDLGITDTDTQEKVEEGAPIGVSSDDGKFMYYWDKTNNKFSKILVEGSIDGSQDLHLDNNVGIYWKIKDPTVAEMTEYKLLTLDEDNNFDIFAASGCETSRTLNIGCKTPLAIKLTTSTTLDADAAMITLKSSTSSLNSSSAILLNSQNTSKTGKISLTGNQIYLQSNGKNINLASNTYAYNNFIFAGGASGAEDGTPSYASTLVTSSISTGIPKTLFPDSDNWGLGNIYIITLRWTDSSKVVNTNLYLSVKVSASHYEIVKILDSGQTESAYVELVQYSNKLYITNRYTSSQTVTYTVNRIR